MVTTVGMWLRIFHVFGSRNVEFWGLGSYPMVYPMGHPGQYHHMPTSLEYFMVYPMGRPCFFLVKKCRISGFFTSLLISYGMSLFFWDVPIGHPNLIFLGGYPMGYPIGYPYSNSNVCSMQYLWRLICQSGIQLRSILFWSKTWCHAGMALAIWEHLDASSRSVSYAMEDLKPCVILSILMDIVFKKKIQR